MTFVISSSICYENQAHPSTRLKGNLSSGIRVYFINKTLNWIYHLNDEQNCDSLASDNNDIRFL
ncbi:DUF3885 domain-containing protein [Sporosarcina gallistercoris]|uniref:DUF3885 domain-containing protein n=1 Tax=Sporosarcina gallistercoris TaxID=2762245 RepID=UPI003D2BF360